MNGFTEKEIHDLNRMNVSCQKVRLGTVLNSLANIENAENIGDIKPFTEKEIHDLNNMNRASQNIKLGTVVNDIITERIKP